MMHKNKDLSRRTFLSRAAAGAVVLPLFSAAPAAFGEEKIRKVHVVFKTHLDIGYTDLAANVIEKYMDKFIPTAIALAKETRERYGQKRFKWTTGSWLVDAYLKRTDSENRRKMEEAIEADDICWHAMPFTTHSEALDASLFEAGIYLSKRLDERFGRKTISAKMTDVPGHTRGIVPILQRTGVNFLHIGVNGASTPPDVPPVFDWHAPDGSHIAVMCQKEYGGVMSVPFTAEAVAILFTGDNHGPQTVEQVLDAYDRLHDQFPDAEVVASDLNAVAEILERVRDKLPAVTSELGDSWIHGIGSDPLKIARMRELSRLRREWLQSERLQAHSDEDLAFAIPLAMVGEHTWGLDIKTHLKAWDVQTPEELKAARTTAPFKRTEASWQEKRDYIRQAVQTLPMDKKSEAEEALAKLQAPDFYQKDFEKIDHPGDVMETTALAFTLDPVTGALVHLENRLTGRQWAAPGHPLALFAYQTFSKEDYERFLEQYLTTRPDWAIADFGKEGIEKYGTLSQSLSTRLKSAWQRDEDNARIILVELEVMDKNEVSPPGCPRIITIEYRFFKAEPKVQIMLQWFEKPANRLPEALWFSFIPLVQAEGAWTLDKMGQDIDPRDVVMNGGRKLHAVGKGVRYADTKSALTIETLDTPLVAPGERSLLNFDNAIPDPEGGMHFCLCNNVWGTNFVMWFEEDMRFRFSLQC